MCLSEIFSICAFAPCGGFGGSVSFLVSCAGEPNRTVTAAFEYPFRLNRAAFAPSLRGLCNGSVWTSDVHLVGDFSSGAQFFVAVAVLAFLYSLAALGLYVAFLPLYRGGRRLPMAAFGFLNLLLWLGSSWFVYKETHLSREMPPPPPPPPLRLRFGLNLGYLGALTGFGGFLSLFLSLGLTRPWCHLLLLAHSGSPLTTGGWSDLDGPVLVALVKDKVKTLVDHHLG
uniref:MARVEL domain-containing protein n=1 Tax=Nothoprocta perdicaria TaxID=30464 RepID=A0A8C6Z4N8_NOTPE